MVTKNKKPSKKGESKNSLNGSGSSENRVSIQRVRLHWKASIEHTEWILTQSDPVKHLWMECQIAEHFGGKDWRVLKTSLQDRSFRRAKAVLEKAGLFQFQAITQSSPTGRLMVIGWKVHNNFGYYNKSYWEESSLRQGRVNKNNYKKFLQGAYWKVVRKLVLTRDNYTCVECGCKNFLQVHHRTYEHHRNEINHLEDLETLCRECHEKKH